MERGWDLTILRLLRKEQFRGEEKLTRLCRKTGGRREKKGYQKRRCSVIKKEAESAKEIPKSFRENRGETGTPGKRKKCSAGHNALLLVTRFRIGIPISLRSEPNKRGDLQIDTRGGDQTGKGKKDVQDRITERLELPRRNWSTIFSAWSETSFNPLQKAQRNLPVKGCLHYSTS